MKTCCSPGRLRVNCVVHSRGAAPSSHRHADSSRLLFDQQRVCRMSVCQVSAQYRSSRHDFRGQLCCSLGPPQSVAVQPAAWRAKEDEDAAVHHQRAVGGLETGGGRGRGGRPKVAGRPLKLRPLLRLPLTQKPKLRLESHTSG